MPKRDGTAKAAEWKEALINDRDFLKGLVTEVLQQFLEAEMVEAVGAGRHERTGERQGYRSGYYGRTLVTRVGKEAGVAGAAGPGGTVFDGVVPAVSAQ